MTDPLVSTLRLVALWDRCWAGLGARGSQEDVCDDLLAAYGEPHRKYHTVQHLGECLALCESVEGLAERPAEIAAGLWFHDAVYETRRADNEARSAGWAGSALRAGGVAEEVVARVCALVLVTQHHAQPADADQQLLIDIDLSILGAPPARFAEYEAQIREEYAFVPDDVFKEKRRAVLASFLDRERIFGTAHFHARREGQARANLERALKG